MKKIISLLLIGSLAMALLPGSAVAAKKKKKKPPPPPQEVEGAVPLPAPYTDDSGCYAGLHRRMVIMTQENVNGVIGFHFDVEEHTWKRNFVLEATGGNGDVDLDIYFYKEFGTVDAVLTDPLNAGSPITQSWNTRGSKYEVGKVPDGMNKVIVCMMAGGTDATFTYQAGAAVKIPKDA